MYQLNFSNKQKNNPENPNQPKEYYSAGHSEGHIQQIPSGYNISSVQNIGTPDNILMPTADYTKSMESFQSVDGQSIATHEHAVSSMYQTNANKVTDNASQNMYDQWYNNNAIPPPIENSWFSKDNIRGTKQWPEQSVENYENIQQPSEFVNLEVVIPALEERDIYGSRDSINRETLDNDPKAVANVQKEPINVREYRQEVNNVEVPSIQQHTQSHRSMQQEQALNNYEFASNDRNTFLETGELTDSHPDHELSPPNQDDENDEVPNDIPFLREVPGQSSSIDLRNDRNDPAGQEQYIQSVQRLSDPRRNDPSGQEQGLQIRNISDRSERRDVPPGQERSISSLSRSESDTLERQNDPSGRERSLVPQQSRNDPSGEERYQVQSQIMLESSEIREIPGRGNEPEEVTQQSDGGLRQIPGGASPNETIQSSDDRSTGRVVTGSQEFPLSIPSISDQTSDSRNKREEAVGASEGGNQSVQVPSVRKDSYENEDDEGSGNSREDSRERHRDASPERRRHNYDYDRKNTYYDREREYDEDYYYERRRGVDNERPYNDFERRDLSYRDDDRKHHSRDDLDRHPRDEIERRNRVKDDPDDRDGRRRQDDRRRGRGDDPGRRERETRDYDLRYTRDREYVGRDRRRDDRRPRRYDDYDIRDPYRREYYEDPYSRSSRPSSRSSYNDRDREYYMRSRDPYYAYNGYGGYDYNAHYGNNYYAYLENLRRTNPAAYAEWYHKYYTSQHPQQHISRGVSNYPEDRASVHSGRSSCEERTTGDKRTLAHMSQFEDSTTTSARLTPTKYSTCHVYGSFSIGSLIHVQPSYPADGERAKVDILRLDNLFLHDPVARDLRAYPGPLIKQVGVTHKKTIIKYCENKIKKATANDDMIDRSSYILLYELMIMLIQQNGNVVGVDIAALLLRNKDAYPYDVNKQKLQDTGRRESVMSQRSGISVNGNNQDIPVTAEKVESTKQQKTVEQMTDEFRNTLLYGLVQEALEYAMTEGLWGHALFLASKLDKRTYASVMTRFANSLLPSDPLQTLYQLHSGRIPAIVTCVSDPRWDDWRPHLAMIISNTSTNPEINRRSITTLGDTLFARGDIYAAHFCYILAQVDFSAYGINTAKLVLIGSNHHKPYSEFMTTEAVMLTEIYEYARNLSEPGFTSVDLQTFKFDLAVKMVDYGLIEKALLYIEQIAVNIFNEPSKYKKSFIMAVYVLGDKIKYHDPVCKDSTEDTTNLTWLNNLAEIVNKYQIGEIVEGDAYESQVNADGQSTIQSQDTHDIKLQSHQQQIQQQWVTKQSEYRDGPTSMVDVTAPDMQSDWEPLSLPSNIQQDTYNQSAQYMHNNESNQYQQPQQQDYWNQQPTHYQNNFGRNGGTSPSWQQQSTQYTDDQPDIDNSQQQEKWNYEAEREEKTSTPEPTQPTISMTPSTGKQYDPLEELDALETPRQTAKSTTENKKTSEKNTEKKPPNGGSSWFGGLFSKLAPKPRNQMILPDDSNPTIVWDPVAKKWMNKDEDADISSAALPPPPKATDMSFKPSSTEQVTAPQRPIHSKQSKETMNINGSKLHANYNMFKLQKGRNMRANYIDVMNPNGGKSSTASPNVPTPATSPFVPMAVSSPQLFIPAPVNDPSAPVDFLTPAPAPSIPAAQPNENVTQGQSGRQNDVAK
ncbi:protein transport protein Sec16A isoform X5 [Vespula pensylvanica]|uniref:protein transport protein Sec16A isoform X5 n=1 Tax=Vespula pensylvanica TaxID=30213 RepID=UPI001CB9EA7D|nr:protein transport protein Sec16A isoform X5 [Vespula pensylvanica]XP_043669315.1 protein transport protein Sec16A isoform X5 [Vespula pensylvanica]